MATYRIGISSEFQLKDNAVGVGSTTTGLGNLIIDGTLKASGLSASGVSTFIQYAGFTPDQISGDITLTGEHLTTGDIVVGTGKTFTVSVGATVHVGTVPSVSIGTHFSPPTGGIEDRPECPVEGTVRFNRDLNTLEFYNGVDWRQFTVSGASGRGVWGNGHPSGSGYQYTNLNTLGNTESFGEKTGSDRFASVGACSDGKRGLFAGGLPASHDVIEYITIGSRGNATDFGNLTTPGSDSGAACSSSTRGVFSGGVKRVPGTAAWNVIEYVEIQTLGNALDFGDIEPNSNRGDGFSSPIRGFFAGGGYPTRTTQISVITIASTGNSIRFGDTTFDSSYQGQCSNTVRGVMAGGAISSPINTNAIDFITMSSEGNAISFGNLTIARHSPAAACTNIRGVFAGGASPSDTAYVNTMDYITFATQGNALDFGDMTDSVSFHAGTSDSHGGLGGY